MAPYIFPWDEATPDGALTPANQIDDLIIALKKAIRERLNDVVFDFGVDTAEPKVLKVQTGLATERPATAKGLGHPFVASDTKVLSIGLANGTWVDIAGAGEPPPPTETKEIFIGLDADRPNPPAAAGIMYFGTDTSNLYIASTKADGGLEWRLISTSTEKIGLKQLNRVYTPTSIVVDHYGPETLAAGAIKEIPIALLTGVPPNKHYLLSFSYELKDDATTGWAGFIGWTSGVSDYSGVKAGGNTGTIWVGKIYTLPNADPTLVNWTAMMVIRNDATVEKTFRYRLNCLFLVNE